MKIKLDYWVHDEAGGLIESGFLEDLEVRNSVDPSSWTEIETDQDLDFAIGQAWKFGIIPNDEPSENFKSEPDYDLIRMTCTQFVLEYEPKTQENYDLIQSKLDH